MEGGGCQGSWRLEEGGTRVGLLRWPGGRQAWTRARTHGGGTRPRSEQRAHQGRPQWGVGAGPPAAAVGGTPTAQEGLATGTVALRGAEARDDHSRQGDPGITRVLSLAHKAGKGLHSVCDTPRLVELDAILPQTRDFDQ